MSWLEQLKNLKALGKGATKPTKPHQQTPKGGFVGFVASPDRAFQKNTPTPAPQPVALPVPVTPAMLAVPGCSNCEAATTKQWHGGYTMQCVGCMARLVLSARPLRHAQEAMLACLESKGSARPGLPTRQQVLERLQRR
jgi:hypothetical protein